MQTQTAPIQTQPVPFRSAVAPASAKIAVNADTPRAREVLPLRLLELITCLHTELEGERQELLHARKLRQQRYDRGELPGWTEEHPAHYGSWRVAEIPEDLMERRVEITGPANSTKMVIQMLNGTPEARADMAMIDFEDSMKPTWTNVIDAVHNVIGAAKGKLATGDYVLRTSNVAHMMVRVRGLHMAERNVLVNGEAISAAIFDLATCAFQTADILVRDHKTPKYYVPKCEHYLEARWWNRLFGMVEEFLELPPGTLRVTFLIETLPAAFQMNEILYEARCRIVGLNGGRWDKTFSDIKVLRNHKDRVLADRSTITMQTPWMENYAKLLIKTCHKRGAFAMGGMAAFTPGKTEEIRKVQAEKVKADKARESSIGHDGCWVSHPYFIALARTEFHKQNQLDVMLLDFPAHPDLLPKSMGPKTLQGLRTNVRVGIGYLRGWQAGLGCVALDHLMEDLATLEISRAQTWQWLHHGVSVSADGREIAVTRELVSRIFDEELARYLSEVADHDKAEYKAAAELARNLFLATNLADFLGEALEER